MWCSVEDIKFTVIELERMVASHANPDTHLPLLRFVEPFYRWIETTIPTLSTEKLNREGVVYTGPEAAAILSKFGITATAMPALRQYYSDLSALLENSRKDESTTVPQTGLSLAPTLTPGVVA